MTPSAPDQGTSAAASDHAGQWRHGSAQADALSWRTLVGWIGIAVVLVFLAVRFCILVRPRAMEFDQISTLLTAEAPSWPAYLAAVPVDSQPPFSHVAVRLGMLLPVPQSIGVHAVSALCMLVAVLCMFLFFQRRGAPLAGVCSAALLAASRCVEYSFTVRPYAALIAVSAGSLLLYDEYRRRRAVGERGSLWPLALTIVLAATIHALTLIYILVPVIAGEALFWFRTRRVDKRLLLAVALSATAFGFDVVLAHEIQSRYMSLAPMSARMPGLPTVDKLIEVLTIPVERRWQAMLLAGALVSSVLLRRRSRESATETSTQRVDLLFPLLAAVALYAAAVLAFGVGVANHYFFTRYAAPGYLCGPLLLGVVLASSAWRRLQVLQVAIAILLFLLPVPALRTFLKSGEDISPTAANRGVFLHDEIIASPLAYPTLWWYARPDERQRMRILTDANSYRMLPDGIPELVLKRFAVAGILPFELTNYRDYRPARDVHLVDTLLSRDTWVPAALVRDGYVCSRDDGLPSETYALTHCTHLSR